MSTTQELHKAFAARAEEVTKEKQIVQRRIAAELYWLDLWLDASSFYPTPDQVPDAEHFDRFEKANYLRAIDQLRKPGMSVHEIHDILDPLTVAEMEQLCMNTEITIGIPLAAERECEMDDSLDFKEVYETISQNASECEECQLALSFLVMSHVVHDTTLSTFVVNHIAHGDQELAIAFRDDLADSLDGAWEKAVARCEEQR